MSEDGDTEGRVDDVQAAAAYESPAARVPAGEPPADLGAIFEQHHGAVYRAAYRVTGNAMDAEDVLQTVFTRLLRRTGGPGADGREAGQPRLDPSQAVGSYLHRAAVNAALDLLRSRRRSRLVAIGDLEHELVDEAGPGPERLSSSRDLGRRLRAAMARLSPRQAEILAMIYDRDMDVAEIAAALRIDARRGLRG